ncbi:hypothetical protein, partial [uncultured Duncaniella sp.]|uniref:hypothetical protein n=1 Tax=uncultured Duncaniella sp. TaxID=2768039 RepID=UPI0025B64837
SIPVIKVGYYAVDVTFIENLRLFLVTIMAMTFVLTMVVTVGRQFFNRAFAILVFLFHITDPPPS